MHMVSVHIYFCAPGNIFISKRVVFLMSLSSFVAEVLCNTVSTELCIFVAVEIYPQKLHKNEGMWMIKKYVLFALSLLNETVILAGWKVEVVMISKRN